LQIRMNLV